MNLSVHHSNSNEQYMYCSSKLHNILDIDMQAHQVLVYCGQSRSNNMAVVQYRQSIRYIHIVPLGNPKEIQLNSNIYMSTILSLLEMHSGGNVR